MTTAAKLLEVLETARGAPLVVLLSGHPDPDSIGAALAHRRICEHVGVDVTIAHIHPVSRLENRAMVKLLGVDLVRVQSTADLQRFPFLSLVDTTLPDPAFPLPDGTRILTVVDHHRGAIAPAPFQDVRLGVGATATIYAQYFESGVVPFGGTARSWRRRFWPGSVRTPTTTSWPRRRTFVRPPDRIDGSLRTVSATVDPGVFMETAFGRDDRGRPYGGGRADKGGFQIPLGMLTDSPDRDALWRLVSQAIRARVGRVVPGFA